jgi:hypothetical protein
MANPEACRASPPFPAGGGRDVDKFLRRLSFVKAHGGADAACCLSRNVFAIFPCSAGHISFGPSFTVSLPILPVKRNGTW